MYIGDSVNPNHLIFELLDNALDEAQAGYATIIGVQIDTKDHVVRVADNGRGLPFENGTVETVCTKLFSGGKFSKGEEGVYKIASGLHGIGIVAVNALSEEMVVEIFRDGKKAKYSFADAKVVSSEIVDYKDKTPFSTQIAFKPNKKYFETLTFDLPSIVDRLELASVHVKELRILFVVDGKQQLIDCDIKDFFNKELLDKSSGDVTNIISMTHNIKDERVVMKFCWDFSGSTSTKSIGSVNLLRVDNGTHINCAYEIFKSVFEELAAKEKLKFSKGDCLVGLRCFISVSLYEAQYSSQTKERLSNPKKDLNHLFEPLISKFKALLLKENELRNNLLAHFTTYRKRLDAKGNIVKTGKNITRLNSMIDSKLRDCTTHTVVNSELFITEGASAGTGLTQCRDPKIHAVLGLKGKIINVADKNVDFFKNKEVIEIVNALGTGVEPDFDFDGLRYGKIIIATDADPDGAHIASLLMTVFLRLVPQLLKNGKIYMAQMPLYGTTANGKFIPLYNTDETDKYRQKFPNAHMLRFKGLGEMNPDQLKVCLIDSTRRLIQIPYPKDPKRIFNIMTDANLKRELV